MPDNAYQMMTAPTQQLASTITNLAGTAAGAYKGFQAEKAGAQALQQGAAAQYSGLESMAQATGVPMNAELANQYANMGQMSPQQQAAFQNSLGEEAQRMQMLYGINQAKARAAQAQGQMQRGVYSQGLTQAIGSFDEPFMPIETNVGATTQVDPSLFRGVNMVPYRPMGQ